MRIYGPEQEELRAAGGRVRDAVAGLPGVADLKLESQILVPQIRIRPRAGDLARFGLTAGDVRRQAQTLIAAQKVGEIIAIRRPLTSRCGANRRCAAISMPCAT